VAAVAGVQPAPVLEHRYAAGHGAVLSSTQNGHSPPTQAGLHPAGM
jgi:hypothetical protein